MFYAKFLYELGTTIGKSNYKWFMKLIELENNGIERVNALPVNLAYLGWCDLQIVEGLDSAILLVSERAF